MRELVYLSERKLAAFHPEPRRRRPGLRGELGVPGIAKVEAELPAAQAAHPSLDDVLTYLTETPGKLRWYTEDGLQPGQWIQFEARLCVVEMRPRVRGGTPVVFFTEPEIGYHGPGCRLVLHGSPDHLRGAVDVSRTMMRGDASDARGIVALLAGLPDTDGETVSPARVDRFNVRMLRVGLARRLDPRAATWLGGCARVTVDAAELGVLIASPLYVEYVSPPAGTPPTSPS
jgi:Family of unknown function (DUF7019)